jgi:hypothetical protein
MLYYVFNGFPMMSLRGQEQPPMSLARRANVGEKQLERLLAQASGGNNTVTGSNVVDGDVAEPAIDTISDPNPRPSFYVTIDTRASFGCLITRRQQE